MISLLPPDGSLNALFPAVVAEAFGVQLLPILYTLIGGPAFALGSLLLSTSVYGVNFDRALERHGLDATMACQHSACYVPSVQTAAAGSALASLLWGVFAFLTRDSGEASTRSNTGRKSSPDGGIRLL